MDLLRRRGRVALLDPGERRILNSFVQSVHHAHFPPGWHASNEFDLHLLNFGIGVRIQGTHEASISALSRPDRFHRDLNPSCALRGQETLIESRLRKPVRSHRARIAAERLTNEFRLRADRQKRISKSLVFDAVRGGHNVRPFL